MTEQFIEKIGSASFGVVFIMAMLILATKFPKPTAFQYTVFRIVLAVAVGGVAAFIPGVIEVTVSTFVKAGSALGVFVVVYFFSPARLVASEPGFVDLPALVKVWEDIRAPNINNVDIDMAHKALNALSLISWYWKESKDEGKRLIKQESFVPFQQWFSVLDSQMITMSDGKSSREHLDGKIRDTYEEMKAYV